ncbi:ERMES complex subunit MDM34 [Kluyveromyces lactis]|uniref:Mitochondrial distribution and morphology protein 34 n=1 Tax=Kluyveromyces lactis (strain ATCC 8585 / CBS 2359 / DSM 70799 / NBRC 1267 / NRRL Y-1140 / WM37) TaxID=284590 RepID=MDM34_KLULA|nr:uncharacterized protein KLLA0_A01573g [Kluyveromyces lactis]Q6CYC1.1 RecName: Full=Mitochondrial distribution and morphology protein 34 [Kluyveromyces lactis NRRL Y-1140]CAH02656.1 KLLA0A01573p [Kluyveromyces lactis]|eukprot:XP_451068.1 uncharacterized protein KLLA0_A01573g [Kluyveromyces lactis]
MSFKFNSGTFEDNTFNEQIRDRLTRALNPSRFENPESTSGQDGSDSQKKPKKLDILKSGVTVRQVDFRTIPQLEILDLDVSAQSKSLLKGICKISCKDAMIQITTEIEANLLLLYEAVSPEFTTPKLISNDSFTVPITMTFDHIELEAITNIFVKNTGVGISFNDVNLDFRFECSMKLLQTSIEKRLKNSMETIFKDVLPSVIFNMSQRWFTHGPELVEDPSLIATDSALSEVTPMTILDDSDLQDLSPATMLRLSTLISSRQSLALNPISSHTVATIPGCIERQNLRRFSSRIPSLNNYYAQEVGKHRPSKILPTRENSNSIIANKMASDFIQNSLPTEVLESGSYNIREIANIQQRIYERNNEENVIRRRRIRLGKRSKSVQDTAAKMHPVPESGSLHPIIQPSTTPAATVTPLLSPQPVVAKSPPESMTPNTLPEQSPYTSNIAIDKIPDLTLPQAQLQKDKVPMRLNLLEESYFKSDLKDLRNSLYSPMRNQRFYVQSEDGARPSLLDGKRFSFVGLANQQMKWGNDDLPPPYKAN